MIIEKEIIYDKNSDGTYYLININNGAKYELYFTTTNCVLCGDEVTENDVKRAKQNDRVDISHLLTKKTNDEEMMTFKKKIEDYLQKNTSKILKNVS